jgi:hypothetical protein
MVFVLDFYFHELGVCTIYVCVVCMCVCVSSGYLHHLLRTTPLQLTCCSVRQHMQPARRSSELSVHGRPRVVMVCMLPLVLVMLLLLLLPAGSCSLWATLRAWMCCLRQASAHSAAAVSRACKEGEGSHCPADSLAARLQHVQHPCIASMLLLVCAVNLFSILRLVSHLSYVCCAFLTLSRQAHQQVWQVSAVHEVHCCSPLTPILPQL